MQQVRDLTDFSTAIIVSTQQLLLASETKCIELKKHFEEIGNKQFSVIFVINQVEMESDEVGMKSENELRRFFKEHSIVNWITTSVTTDHNVTALFERIVKSIMTDDLKKGSRKSSSSHSQSLNDMISSDGNTGIFEELGLQVETAELVTKGLSALSSARLIYPFKNASQTLALHLALYLRANNPKYSKERLQRCAAHLAQFERECQIIPYLADHKDRFCQVRQQIEDEEEREEYATNATIFDDIQHKKHQIPGSQSF